MAIWPYLTLRLVWHNPYLTLTGIIPPTHMEANLSGRSRAGVWQCCAEYRAEDMGVKESAVDLFSGSAGGTAVVLVGQPMDTIKVKMQTFGHMYSGIWDCLVRTVKTDGVARGLYAGTTPALVAYISENSVLFAALGLTQKLVARVSGVAKVEDLSLVTLNQQH